MKDKEIQPCVNKKCYYYAERVTNAFSADEDGAIVNCDFGDERVFTICKRYIPTEHPEEPEQSNARTTDTNEIDYSDHQPLPEQQEPCPSCGAEGDEHGLICDEKRPLCNCAVCADEACNLDSRNKKRYCKYFKPKQPKQEPEEWKKEIFSIFEPEHEEFHEIAVSITNNAEGIQQCMNEIKDIHVEIDGLCGMIKENKKAIDKIIDYQMNESVELLFESCPLEEKP